MTAIVLPGRWFNVAYIATNTAKQQIGGVPTVFTMAAMCTFGLTHDSREPHCILTACNSVTRADYQLTLAGVQLLPHFGKLAYTCVPNTV